MRKITLAAAMSLIVFAVSLTSGASPAAGPVKTTLGSFAVLALHTSDIEMSTDLIRNGDKDEIRKIIPSGKITVSINAFVVKTPRHTVLVDGGMGADDELITQMEKAGISPGEVDIVLLTHGHFDHVGGLVKNGKAVFGKARVMMAEKDAVMYGDDALAKLPQDMKRYFIPGNSVLSVYKDRFSTFVPGSAVVDGITSLDLGGHTPGHTGYLVESEGKKLLIAGDFMHISVLQLAHPEYSLMYDSDIPKAVEARKSLLDTLSRDRILLAGSHFDYPGIGSIRKSGSKYVYIPLN